MKPKLNHQNRFRIWALVMRSQIQTLRWLCVTCIHPHLKNKTNPTKTKILPPTHKPNNKKPHLSGLMNLERVFCPLILRKLMKEFTMC